MAITVDPITSPRVITVLAPDVSITIQQLLNLCRDWEDDNLEYPHLINASGKENLGGGVYVGLTAVLQNAKLAFEARPPSEYIQCQVSGGNLVALDGNGAVMPPIVPTAYTQVVTSASSSATISELSASRIWDDVNGVETGLTPRGAMRLMAAVLAGKVSGAPAGPVLIRNVGDTVTRVVATVDGNGNRTDVTVDAE